MNRFFYTLMIIIACVAIAFTPYWFTADAVCDRLNFTETGNVGDTIGGITAPFVGILNAILLFITLTTQINFNKKQSKDNDLTNLIELQSVITTCDNNLTYHYTMEENGIQSKTSITKSGLFSLCDIDPGEIRCFSCKSMEILMLNLQKIRLLCASMLHLSLVSNLEVSSKNYFNNFAKSYLQQILAFYEHVGGYDIKIIETAMETFKADDGTTTKNEIQKKIDLNMDDIRALMSRFKLNN